MIKKFFVSALPMLVVFLFDNVVNNSLGLYDRWRWLDIPMHLLGGVVAAWSCHRFYKKIKNEINIKPLFARLWLYVGTTAIIGILWEVYEFLFHVVTRIITQPSVGDTVHDLVNDLIGAVLFCGLIFLFDKNKKKMIKRE